MRYPTLFHMNRLQWRRGLSSMWQARTLPIQRLYKSKIHVYRLRSVSGSRRSICVKGRHARWTWSRWLMCQWTSRVWRLWAAQSAFPSRADKLSTKTA
jgi:hypothetical protein